MNWEFAEEISRLMARGDAFVIATLVDVEISAPQKPGAKALFVGKNLHAGTVGGGKLEARIGQLAAAMLDDPKSPKTAFYEWNLKSDIGMTCGGIVRVFLELINHNPWQIVIFGAGHVAQALAPRLLELNSAIQLTIIDPRSQWLAKFAPHRQLTLIQHEMPSEVVTDYPPNAYYLSLTQGHSHDLPIIEAVARRGPPPYWGVIGSASKAIVLKRELIRLGVDPESLATLRCPIGLPLGGRSPAEIALSIAAEMLETWYRG